MNALFIRCCLSDLPPPSAPLGRARYLQRRPARAGHSRARRERRHGRRL